MRTTLLLLTLAITSAGCKTLQSMVNDPSMCDAIKEGSFAVATFGCMRIDDLPSRDACTKAGLAGALLAKQACLAKLAKDGNQAAPEIGDPMDPKDAETYREAHALINEWKALESPASRSKATSTATSPAKP